jgi:exodeoxyribonuclease III
VLCLQEIKCRQEDVGNPWPASYAAFFNSAKKLGYAGTAILTKKKPVRVDPVVEIAGTDEEGRLLCAEFDDFFLLNVYVPNSKRDLSRLPYRQTWDREFLRYIKRLERRKPVVFCGDLNVAHREIDLANPKANQHNHGFTPEERAGFDALVKAGMLDTFRELDKSPGKYTWWSPMGSARAKNIGWRLDYFLISAALRPRLKRAFIRQAVRGSDHCPVGLEMK